MIRNLHLKGFKCFDDEHFDILPVTILSGLNSSGKSSVIQAIRTIYNGGSPLAGLGPFNELISTLHNEFLIELTEDTGFDYILKYPKTNEFNYPYESHYLMSYIPASRLGPEQHLPIFIDGRRGHYIGEKCEYVLDFLEYYSNLSDLPDALRRSDTNSAGVYANASSWLSLISPGVRLELEPIFKADIVRAEYNGRRSSNVGFGLSYALPIIAISLVYAALLATGEYNKAAILIENPEAHLHPAGQTQLGIFLATAASCGVQVIVETHSDHFLNGIRIAVKNNIISCDNTSFYFFKYDFDDEKSSVYKPVLDEDGYFDEWPDGFFDETEKNLERLLES